MTPKELAAMQQALEALESKLGETHPFAHSLENAAASRALREALAEPQITTPDVCGEVCARAKLCYGCGKALDEANASWMLHDELKAYWSGYGNGKQKALSEPVAFKFPREPKPEQSMGWTIDHKVIRSVDAEIEDNEFKPCCESVEQVLLALEKVYAAPVQQAEQEPVAYTNSDQLGYLKDPLYENAPMAMWSKPFDKRINIPLYAAPVRTKDLTDEEIKQVWLDGRRELGEIGFARAVIAADREKNRA